MTTPTAHPSNKEAAWIEAISPPHVSSFDWAEQVRLPADCNRRFARGGDPLPTWEKKFREWISDVVKFREMEVAFFGATDSIIGKRVHRGWTCGLIAKAEMLAIELLKTEVPIDEKTRQIEFLEAFIDNLQSSVMTWHSLALDWSDGVQPGHSAQ